MKWETVAEFSFLGGIVLAFILGTLHAGNDSAYNLLMVLGSIVGLVNIFDSQLERFTNALVVILLSTITFAVLGAVSANSMLVFFKDLSIAIALFTAPVAFIMALKELYDITLEYKKKKEKRTGMKRRKTSRSRKKG